MIEHSRILPVSPGPGTRAALVAAAGPLPPGAAERAVARVRALGWNPVLAPHAAGRRGYLAADDTERLADLQEAIDSEDFDLIWLVRGGYGVMRIVERIRWQPLIDRPRPLIGFSDNTVLHLAAHRSGLVTFHGPHPAAADLSDFSLTQMVRVLRPAPAGILPMPPEAAGVQTIVGGQTEGRLVGGNLALLAATMGTPFQVDAEGAILFVEEVGEPAYRVDRLLTQLKMGGVLHRVAGIAVGAITECADAGTAGIPTLAELLQDRLGGLGVPIAYDFPFGHIARSWTLPVGIRARLDADAGTLQLLESAVTDPPMPR